MRHLAEPAWNPFLVGTVSALHLEVVKRQAEDLTAATADAATDMMSLVKIKGVYTSKGCFLPSLVRRVGSQVWLDRIGFVLYIFDARAETE